MAGVTFVADMPNNKPLIVNDDSFKEKLNKIKGRAWIDYGLYAGVSKNLVKEATLYKLYLSHDNDIFVEYEELPDLLKKIKEKGALLAIHAEEEKCIKREGGTLEEYEKNSPIECEIKAVEKILKASKTSFGVTLHHILFSYKSRFKKDAMGKVNPPLRSEGERKNLYRMVMNGKIPVLESDHAPHTIEEKENFDDAKPGMPGVDALLPVMLYFVKIGRVKLKKLVRMVAENPARLMGIDKGSISVGRDADFIIVDFNNVGKVRALSKCGWSCYEGMNAIYPRYVWMRGEIVVEDGEIVGEPRGMRLK